MHYGDPLSTSLGVWKRVAARKDGEVSVIRRLILVPISTHQKYRMHLVILISLFQSKIFYFLSISLYLC
jgi:hypothetical protein